MNCKFYDNDLAAGDSVYIFQCDNSVFKVSDSFPYLTITLENLSEIEN